MAPRKKSDTSMKRVAEGIYRRPSGKYAVPIYDPATDRKTYKHPDVPRGGFDSLEEAKAFKRRIDEERDASKGKVVTCDLYAKEWITTHARPEQSTNDHNKERLNAFRKDFKGVPMNGIPRPVARLWTHGGAAPKALEKVAAGWAGVKRVDGELVVPGHRSHHQVVRAMFNDAVEDQVVARNPFSALRVPHGSGREDVVMLTDAELDKLVATAAETWGENYGGRVFGPMIRVAAGTGMRPGELYAMRWHWVNWEDDSIDIKRALQSRTGKETPPGKTRKEPRTVAMIPMVRAALQLIPHQEDDDHVFYTPSAAMVQRTHYYYWASVRSAFYATLEPHRKEEIDPKFDWYELRHWFGTYLAGLPGITPGDIADQMGHSDGGTLAMKLYIHTENARARSRVLDAVRKAQTAAGESATG